MTLYPDVARKAQAELDAVVGTDRLPRFSDRENLPYTNAVVLETMRWYCVTPTGKLSPLHPLNAPLNKTRDSSSAPSCGRR